MRIAFVEINNFRKLLAVRIDLTENKTLFVGANNSGKTSALLALRRFLVDRGDIGIHDFSLEENKRDRLKLGDGFAGIRTS
jgi:predicted ATP-dependent endonuclease of OLD family